MTTLAHALYQVSLGRRVVALHGIILRNGTPVCTCGKTNCHSPGKHPFAQICRNGLKDATDDPEQVKEWFGAYPFLNYGIVWGRRSHAFAIDIDIKPLEGIDGQDTWSDLASRWGVVIDTETVLTGSGGLHYIFQYPHLRPEQHIPPSQGVLGLGIDVRGDDSYTVGPGCAHIAGRRYEYEVSSDPEEVDDPVRAQAPPRQLVELVIGRASDGKPPPELPTEECESTEEGRTLLAAAQVRLLDAPDGERLDARCAAGMRAGRLIAARLISPTEAIEATVKAAMANTDQPEHEVRRTITNYARIGLKYPWQVREAPPPPCDEDAPRWADDCPGYPDPADLPPLGNPPPKPTEREPGADEDEPPPKPPRLAIRSFATIQPRPVRWLWNQRIPLGKLSIIDGDPGLGKSTATLDIAARVSRGDEMPDGRQGEEGAVILLSAEDDPEDTIQPRLAAAGANMDRIHELQGRNTHNGVAPVALTHDLPALHDAIVQLGAVLVVIDPLVAYMGATDTHKDADVRQTLAPLAQVAAKTRCAIVGVRHLNKGVGGKAVHRGGGSIAIGGAARTVHLVAEDPDNPAESRIWAGVKNNLAPPSPSLRYHMETVGHVARVVWDGTCDATADSLCAAPAKKQRDKAVDFLEDILHEGPMRVEDVFTMATEQGISNAAIRRAKGEVGIQSKKAGMDGGWVWSLQER